MMRSMCQTHILALSSQFRRVVPERWRCPRAKMLRGDPKVLNSVAAAAVRACHQQRMLDGAVVCLDILQP